MNKQFIVIAALACCSHIAQAGILKESFQDLCKHTGTTPTEIPMQALTDPTVKNVGMATIAPSAKVDAFKIIDTWDKTNISMTLEDEDDTAVIYMAPASKNDNTQECIVVVNQKSDPQLMLIYLEGDENLLDKINIGGN